MEPIEEMRKWVESLTMPEKRFLKLFTQARPGTVGSQHLEYFDWLNNSKSGDPPPKEAKFLHNLPTVTQRLKELILDSLRLQHKAVNVDAALHTALTEIALLRERGLVAPATRLLRRTKLLALSHGRYPAALHTLQIEQAMVVAAADKDAGQNLLRLRNEELSLLQAQAEFAEIRHQHALLQARGINLLVPRTSDAMHQLLEFADSDLVRRLAASPQYLERTFAWNLLAYRAFVTGTTHETLPKLAALLQEWNIHPDWQQNEPSLLFFASNFYQNLVFSTPMPTSELHNYLRLLPDFKGLPLPVARDFRRMILHHQFVITMNTGQLQRLPQLLTEIDQWLSIHHDALPVARVLPFLHNCLVAEFILGDLKAARKRIRQIATMPNRKVRQDIREFALLLQAVLLFEQGDEDLDDYLLRANKRHFQQNPRADEFELFVIRYMETCIADPGRKAQATAELVAQLDALASRIADGLPPLGLNELRLWAQARHRALTIREVFLEVVNAYLTSNKEGN